MLKTNPDVHNKNKMLPENGTKAEVESAVAFMFVYASVYAFDYNVYACRSLGEKELWLIT